MRVKVFSLQGDLEEETVAVLERGERKVWTSQERMPAKGWGP